MTTSLPANALLPSPVPARRAAGGGLLAVVGALFVPGGAAAAGATPAVPARDVQERLASLGLLPLDAVSGRFDRRTADAVARFQARAGLRVDGVPGGRTADLLLAG
jgi:peptidoglycan hydrolase-like protein with peptidoglycan-binding domain